MKVADYWTQKLQGIEPERAPKGPETTETQICATCREFVSQCNRAQENDVIQVLETAEQISEMILGYYGSLRQAALH